MTRESPISLPYNFQKIMTTLITHIMIISSTLGWNFDGFIERYKSEEDDKWARS